MRTTVIRLLALYFISASILSCRTKPPSDPNGPVTDNCKDVPKLTVQNYKNNAKAAAQLIQSFSAAAKADLEKIKDLSDLQANINAASKLSRTLNQNVEVSSKVTEKFWEQELAFRQIICLYKSIVDDKNTPEDVKKEYYKGIQSFSKQRIEYMFYEKKKSGVNR